MSHDAKQFYREVSTKELREIKARMKERTAIAPTYKAREAAHGLYRAASAILKEREES